MEDEASVEAKEFGAQLPFLRTVVPGPESRALAERLGRVESRNVTYMGDEPPIAWAEAKGANVRDADGNTLVDLTSAFGVALAGHAHPSITAAVRDQMAKLIHGMGDIQPPAIKVELLERLAAHAPWSETRGVLASTGSEAVEIALKTAQLATGRAGVVAFQGGYHGLTMGSLATVERGYFRDPFEGRLFSGVSWAPFPGGVGGVAPEDALSVVEAMLSRDDLDIGAVLIEPVQGRGGIRIPAEGFMASLSEVARARGALVIADEILSGMGRCGAWWASERVGLEPDIVCIGKALGGGLPISACLGERAVMDAWPPSPGEALHTSTFLGHPLGCAAALASLDLLENGLVEQADRTGNLLRSELTARIAGRDEVLEVRGLGAAVGVELATLNGQEGPGAVMADRLLQHGMITLPAGDRAEVLEFLPPAVLTPEQIAAAVSSVERVLEGGLG